MEGAIGATERDRTGVRLRRGYRPRDPTDVANRVNRDALGRTTRVISLGVDVVDASTNGGPRRFKNQGM